MNILFRKYLLRITVFCIVISLCFGSLAFSSATTLKEKFMDTYEQPQVSDGEMADVVYSKIERENQASGYQPATGPDISVKGKDAVSETEISAGADPAGGADEVLLWTDEHESYSWEFSVPTDGLYNISVEYYPLDGTGSAAQRALYIDGEIPFQEAYNIAFPRLWRDKAEPIKNSIGDEVRPAQEEIRRWRNLLITDNQGLYSRPFSIYFSKGEHTLSLKWVAEPIAIKSITLKVPEKTPTYAEKVQMYKQNGYQEVSEEAPILIEAEKNVAYKSDSIIRREYNGDPMSQPTSRGDRLLNVIGGPRWSDGGQEITWQFYVMKTGLYRIDLRVGNWTTDGLPVFRSVYIDGQIPFEEMREYPFDYSPDWRLETLSQENGEPFLFYLEEGKHTITMKAVLGMMTGLIQEIQEDAVLLSEMYRKIIMLTGVNPDPNYEYDLHKSIPGLLDNFRVIRDSMGHMAKLLTDTARKRPSAANNFLTIEDQLDKLIKRPINISRGMDGLQNALSSMGNYIISLRRTPLLVDYFMISPPSADKPKVTSNFVQKFLSSVQNFVRSFFKDYDHIASIYEGDENNPTINIWVGRGIEWAEIIKQLSDEDFTSGYQINVNMNILPGSQLSSGSVNAIMLAIASGNAPDLALGVGSDSPVEFAIRNAVTDFKNFPDYQEVFSRFYPNILVPFSYNGGVYAIPEQMNFFVLFYRKDILSEMKINVPNTWTEVYEKTLPILSRNGMQFAPTGYSTFLYQLGGNYYTDDGLKSALDSSVAYQAFKEWTDQYTCYGMPIEFNFFNRFRTGEMPIGIANYSMYVQIATAAPELYGRWGIAMVPGHIDKDGNLNRSIGGIAGACAVILRQSDKQEEAWEFLKWWTGTDVQVQFGRELEALLGTSARWNSANIEAFKLLPWDRNDRNIILEQMKTGYEMPVVLGGYFTSRHLNNAWTRVVTGGENERDSLEEAVKAINTELRTKQEEYSAAIRPESNEVGYNGKN